MRLSFEVRDKVSGVGIAGAPAAIKSQSSGDTIPGGNVIADASGLVTYQQDGSPGDVYAEVTIGTEVKRYGSRATGPSGLVQVGELPELLRALLPGVVQGVDASLAVHSTGAANLSVAVGSGLALLQGVSYRQYTNPKTVALGAAHPTNPRIDLLVARGDQVSGVTTLVVKSGTPASVPVAPTVTQSSAIWEEGLAQVRVEAGTLTVDEAKITDVRRFVVTSIPTGSVTNTMLAADSVTSAKIQENAVGPSEIASGAVSTDELANLSVSTAKIALLAVTAAQIADATIPESKLAAAVVTKLNATGPTVPADGSITLAKMAANSVDSSKIVDATIVAADIANATITGGKIATGTVAEANLTTAVQTKLNATNGNQTIDVYGPGIGLASGNPAVLDFKEGFAISLNATDNVRIALAFPAPIVATTTRDGTAGFASTTSTTGALLLSVSLVIPSDDYTYDVEVEGYLGFFNSTNVWSGIEVRLGGTASGYVGGAGATFRDFGRKLTVLDVAPGTYTVALYGKTNSGTLNYDGGWVRATATPR